jgi:PhnB protein
MQNLPQMTETAMSTPIPYLFFQGCCAEAMTTYARILDADPPDIMRVSSAPDSEKMPPGSADLVMHSALKVGDGWIYASDDVFGGTPAMQGCSMSLSYTTVGKARAVFDALAEGGTIRMDWAPMFFTPGMGTLTDRFGTQWMILTDDPNRNGPES